MKHEDGCCEKERACLCSVEGVLNIISKKWAICIISHLGEKEEGYGFNELQRSLNGKYTIPYGSRCREKVDVLVDELRCMAWDKGRVVCTSEHKDTVMGLWLAELGIEENPTGNRFSIIRSW